MTTFGDLTGNEIEALLREQYIGRIGCISATGPYIVPVSYVYDGTYIYGYSPGGMKLKLMTANPAVCFQIDDVEDLTHWRSVIGFGRFEPLAGERAYGALELLAARLRVGGALPDGSVDPVPSFVARRGGYGVAYRIMLVEKTGRYERPAANGDATS